jgi:hypothetical protein
MKKILLVNLGLLIMLLGACKKENFITCKLDRDCTGVYLIYSNENYYVCNTQTVESFPTGKKLLVKFNTVENCIPDSNEFVCLKLHPYKSIIHITEIK